MSESAPEGEEVEETEETETPPVPEDDGEESEEDTPADVAKLQKQLKRAKDEAIRNRLALKKLKEEAEQGDPNKGEMEKLAEQVEKLQKGIATGTRITALLEAGFNQSAAKAEGFLRLVNNFDDDEWIEELKVDFPERFGRARRQASGDRPFSGGGRDETRGKKETQDERFARRLMDSSKRR